MHTPLSTATEPESSSLLPESLAVPPASEPPLEDPLLDELPLEEPLLEEPPLEEPPLEEPPLDAAPPESSPLPLPPPLEEPFGAAPSLDSPGFVASGEFVAHAGTTRAVTSAKPQRRTVRAFMVGDYAIPMPCSSELENAGRS